MSSSRLTGYLGAMLIAVGALITWLCGTCTWTFLDHGHAAANSAGFMLVIIVGGVPTLLGLSAIFVGVVFLMRGLEGQTERRQRRND